ncbi:elicitor-responsive protein 1 [Dorcoceras hygrometricum]|uniref:Elicitor-responsive protein 1 n=1 Tax=Dorcoceras hygrometricum TaxID=472368 RepID=A0A2Z7AYH4_9LAMI|nr:elicitor-responsive protein 1 [Dorcoceras hygrometricum]
MTIGIMEVTLLQARGLKNREFLGKIDPYVLIRYENEEQKSRTGGGKTSKFRKYFWQGSDPVWNEKFKFRVKYPIKGDEHPKLILKIIDKDTFTQDDFVGQATINLKELFEIGVENGMAELPPQKYRVVSTNKAYHGEIQVGVTFIAQVSLPGKKRAPSSNKL